LLLVAAPRAQRGNVVELEAWLAGHWRILRHHRLRRRHRTAFLVRERRLSVTYRVVLLATAEHGQSVSAQVTIPARAAPLR